MTQHTFQTAPQGDYALVVGAVFDSRRGELVHNRAVHLRGDQIVAMCAPGELPDELPRVPMDELTLVPGLIDVHVHSEDWHAPLYLAKGVTTVRDVGCELNSVLDRRARWNRQGACAPRLVCTGPLLDCPGNTWHATTQIVNSPEEARARVDELVERGVDQIKCYAFLDYPCFQAIVERAHHHNKFAVVHLGKHVNARQAIEAGIDEIEHLSGVGEALWAERNAQGATWDFYRLWANMDTDRANELLDEMMARGTWLAITRLVWVRLATTWDQRHRAHPQMAYVPPPLQAFWDTFAPNNPVGRVPKGIRPPSRMDRSQQAAGMSLFTSELVRRAYDRILIGTDAPFPYLLPGFSYHDEIAALMDCGMSERTALQAATLWGARALEIDDEVGSIEPGKRADMILIQGDPLEDFHALENIQLVIRDGAWLDPAQLLAEAGAYARTARPSPVRRFDAYY